MVYTPVDIMAIILIVVAVIKIVVILVNPKSWINLVKKIWANPGLMMIITLVLAAITLFYLIQELTIVQIFAVMLFLALLAGVGISVYSKEVVGIAEKMLKDKSILKKSWLYLIIWIALIVWAVAELFL